MQAFTEEKLKERIHSRPVAFLALSALAGAVAVFYLPERPGARLLPVLAIALCGLISAARAREKAARPLAVTAACLIAAGLALGLGLRFVSGYGNAALPGGVYTVTGRVEKTTDGAAIVSDLSVSGERGRVETRGKLRLYTDLPLSAGDVVRFESALENAWSDYDLSHNIRYVAAARPEITDSRPGMFGRIGRALKDVLREGMGERVGGIAAALLLGDLSDADGGDLAAFRRGGVAHIFAVSGLHIGFLAGLLALLFRLLRVRRSVGALIAPFALFFYSGVCGFSPSSVRAAVMCTAGFAASSSGEKYDGINALALSVLILILVRPANVADIGFQLSVSAVLSIQLFARPLTAGMFDAAQKIFRLRGNAFTRPRVWRAAGATATVLAVQIGTLPLTLSAFGYVAALGVFFNLLLIPLVGIAFPLTLVLALFSLIGGAETLLYLPSLLIRVSLGAVLLPDGGAATLSLSPLAGLLYYGALFALAEIFRLERYERAAAAGGCCALFALSVLLSAGAI